MRTSVAYFVRLMAAVVMAFATAAFADEPYQYIKTPGYDPFVYSTNTCSIEASSASSLATGTHALPAAEPSGFEARFRTWFESLGTRLKSTKFRHFIINFH